MFASLHIQFSLLSSVFNFSLIFPPCSNFVIYILHLFVQGNCFTENSNASSLERGERKLLQGQVKCDEHMSCLGFGVVIPSACLCKCFTPIENSLPNFNCNNSVTTYMFKIVCPAHF